ncbi:MAG TPA: pullulanase-type alpha-1,6-glucosidase [Anaerolineales bacterium]|nr:pullulanase-type alpha-1,6-glucosidase [Anaerolineales bacterium]
MKRILFLLPLLLTASTPLLQELPPEGLPVPQIVAIAGTLQPALGCSGEWNTDCEETFLTLDGQSLVWRATWELPAGSYEYKVALNGSWTDNFGLGGEYYGANIPLVLEEAATVTFIYSHETHFVADSVNHIIANVPGSFQDEIGCPGEWAPDCLRSWLQDPDGDGIYTWSTTWIPQGDYEAKVAVNESWTENYGADGAQDGSNIPFTVGDFDLVTFTWDSVSKIMTIATEPAPEGSPTSPPSYAVSTEKPQPASVTIPGTIQSLLGCSADWQPDCAATHLVFDEEDRIWQNEWTLPAGDYLYKAAINDSWDLNFGQNATQGGADIPLSVPADGPVKFYYDHQTGWVTDNVNTQILTVIGDFQTGLGCTNNDDAGCLRSWLQDPNGDGIYTALLRDVPTGSYTAAVALGEDSTNLLTEPSTFNIQQDPGVVYFEYDVTMQTLKIAEGEPSGDLTLQQAHWVLGDTIAWDLDPEEAVSFELFYAPEGGMSIEPAGLAGAAGSLSLNVIEDGLPEAVREKFPHLAGFMALQISPEDVEQISELLRGQVAVAAYNATGAVIDITALQIAGALDDRYAYDGPLGLAWDGDVPTFRVWAPTAKTVSLNIYTEPGPNVFPQSFEMTRDDATGVWSLEGQPQWRGRYYAYEVTVYVPSAGGVQENVVTDPYSVALSTNAVRSLVVDLNDPDLFPEGWAESAKPPLAAPEDIVLYELHVRDFSVNDPSVPEEFRGTFMAFTVAESNGMAHIKALAEAGLTHLHLLPVFDIASVNEDKSTWHLYDFEALSALPPDSEEQQAAVSPDDAFNWGYDPVHFGVPDGAYTTDPEGTARILEFRQMVMALHEAGLRVVMDVVYNHTNASGQRSNSVLDRIVPGYYHRLNANGQVETSTCCQNTATEHDMMRKLMIDTLVTWATAYGVDGFRFDLMGHHMRADMEAVRTALDAIDPSIYVYGEGWDFGEVAGNRRGINGTQLNMGGTGIGTFNDRVRDSVRGGSPFGGHLEQGFATGLYTDPNETSAAGQAELDRLLLFTDRIIAALAGNLAGYTFIGASGEEITGAGVDYNGSPTGYTEDPQEHIIYISAHDNETWFDGVQYKAPASATVADRVRMHNLGIDLVGYAQGIPFFHAGIDMLRSKSFDRDSFNSGDWFNRLDFTYQESGWGSGLPVAEKNQENWPIMAPLLGNPDIAPGPNDIQAALQHFRETLAIRKSSPLFRLQTAEQIIERVSFYNSGPDQVPGLIVMSLSDRVSPDLDPEYEQIVVLFNAAPDPVSYTIEELADQAFTLHPVQLESYDEVVRASAYDPDTGTFTVPGRTAAVFVLRVVAGQIDPDVLPPPPTPRAAAEEPADEPIAPPAPPEGPNTGLIAGILAGLIALFAGAYLIRRRQRGS